MRSSEQKNRGSRQNTSTDARRTDCRRRLTMTTEDRTKLRNVADRLRVTLDELKDLGKTTDDPGVRQAALSTQMALAWIDLVGQFTAEDKSQKE
jgi:hypothetical protein